MKKKIAIGIAVLLAVILLLPIPMRLKDGGTVVYQAVLYRIEKVHRLAFESADGYETGTVVRILGVEIYNDVK